MLQLISLLLMGLDCLLGAPTGREVYRMPQSALKGSLSKLALVFSLVLMLRVVKRVAVSGYIYICSSEAELIKTGNIKFNFYRQIFLHMFLFTDNPPDKLQTVKTRRVFLCYSAYIGVIFLTSLVRATTEELVPSCCRAQQ